MGSEVAKAVYKERAATAECVNAQCRNRGRIHTAKAADAEVRLWTAFAAIGRG